MQQILEWLSKMWREVKRRPLYRFFCPITPEDPNSQLPENGLLLHNQIREELPTNRPRPGSSHLGKARTPKQGLVELPEFKQQDAELFASRLLLAQIVR